MKFHFFKRGDNKVEEAALAPEERGAAPADSAELCKVEGSSLNLELYEHVTFDGGGIGGEAYIDALIPLAANVVNAAAQWNQAIVRFPEGMGWNDLLNRKTPGWEEWKQLGILKDGKFKPQAAIKHVKLQPAAVANLALQGAAIVVGQVYMTEINKQLEGIHSGISALQEEMRFERDSNLEASFELLREYLTDYAQISDNPEKKRAVHGQIEGIRKDALAAWNFQLKSMRSFDKRLAASKKMKNDEVDRNISEFQSKENAALTAFMFLTAAERASMQYDNDFSEARIAAEKRRFQRCFDDYEGIRASVQRSLAAGIDKYTGGSLAIADAIEDGYTNQNPVLDLIHMVRQNVPRIWIPNMREKASRELEQKKACLTHAAMQDSRIASMAGGTDGELAKLDFIYNHADSIVVDRRGIHFIDSKQPSDEGTAHSADAAF